MLSWTGLYSGNFYDIEGSLITASGITTAEYGLERFKSDHFALRHHSNLEHIDPLIALRMTLLLSIYTNLILEWASQIISRSWKVAMLVSSFLGKHNLLRLYVELWVCAPGARYFSYYGDEPVGYRLAGRWLESRCTSTSMKKLIAICFISSHHSNIPCLEQTRKLLLV